MAAYLLSRYRRLIYAFEVEHAENSITHGDLNVIECRLVLQLSNQSIIPQLILEKKSRTCELMLIKQNNFSITHMVETTKYFLFEVCLLHVYF